jgi:hypothetical protein
MWCSQTCQRPHTTQLSFDWWTIQGRPTPRAGSSTEPGLRFFGAQLWNFLGQIFKSRSIKYFNKQLLIIWFEWSSGCRLIEFKYHIFDVMLSNPSIYFFLFKHVYLLLYLEGLEFGTHDPHIYQSNITW